MSALDDVIDELADRVAARILAKLSAPSEHYTSRGAGPHPPGKSRAWALRTLKKIPGAQKVGRDWVISVADYETWLTERDTARCADEASGPRLVSVRPTPTERHVSESSDRELAERAERSLLASGYRRSR